MPDSAAIAAYWDAAADAFDDEPDHGLAAARTRRAWAVRLGSWLPGTSARVLDVGCGTGSVSCLLAEAGHRVTGVDLAPRMIEKARAKFRAAGLPGRFLVGDAADPPTGAERFDALISRHLVWTLPDPHAAIREWATRLRPGGLLILIEGHWHDEGHWYDADPSAAPYVSGAESLPWDGGVRSEELASVVRPLVTTIRIDDLTTDADLWGRPVTDERYALIAAARSEEEA